DAAENSMALLKLNPYVSSDVYFVSSVAHLNLNKIDLAEEHAREAVRNGERGTNPRAFHLLSIILAQKNDISGAADNLRTYLKLLPDAPNASQAKKQLAELEQALSARGDGGRPSTAQ
ncbi:MAG TPA: tetratricopeptide repeat protein, partial [Bryobacteraceae bacterium]|nr:tetratricopeptide repeat protein [Bryobacteraceae bacterium]